MATDKEQRGIQSIEVGGQLLQVLVEHGAAMTLRDLAQQAGMSSAKAHPYLVSFGKLGLIEQNQLTGRYELGPFALQMGLISLQLLDPVRIAVPEITKLAADIGHTVALAVCGSHGPTIIYIIESSQPIHVNMRTGTVMSTINTATGQVFSAYLPAKMVDHFIARELRDADIAGQAMVPPSRSQLETLFADVRQRGLARAVGRPIPSINAISAPVFNHGGAIALAITGIGPEGTFDADWQGDIARAIRECAANISYRLGFREA